MSGFIVQPQTFFAIGPSRSFGQPTFGDESNANQPVFSGYVTLTESTIDAIEITQQPVQQGAPIADHAFKKPVSFSIQIIFSAPSALSLNPLQAFSNSSSQSLSSIYQKLVDLQSTFVPFNCITPKRTYSNMLLASLGQTTDKKTENCLAINASFYQVILVPIGVTTIDPSKLRNKSSNIGTQKSGPKQLQSTLFTGSQALGFSP